MAKAIFMSMEESRKIEVLSRGLVVLFSEPINPKVEAVLNNHNITLEDVETTQLDNADLDEDTLVLTMSDTMKQAVLDEYDNVCDVYSITEFVGQIGEVFDPCGGTLADYESCYGELSKLVKKTIYKIDEIEIEAL